MDLISENNKIFENNLEQVNILNSKLLSIKIYAHEADGVCIELNFHNDYIKVNPMIKLIFKKVLSYSFYHESGYSFYNVESFKLLALTNNKFYLSLDPFDEKEEVSEEDQDFIIAKHIALYY
jgi:hypothetical protein